MQLIVMDESVFCPKQSFDGINQARLLLNTLLYGKKEIKTRNIHPTNNAHTHNQAFIHQLHISPIFNSTNVICR